MNDHPYKTAQAATPVRPCGAIPIHVAETLTEGGPTAHIRLENQTYILRITRSGKLILTK